MTFSASYFKANLLLLILLGVLNGCSSTPEPQSSPAYSAALQGIQKAFDSQQKIWRDFNFTDHPTLFISNSEKRATLLDKGQLHEQDYGALPESLKNYPVHFTFTDFQKRPHLVILADKYQKSADQTAMVHLTVHEGFHFFYQHAAGAWVSKVNSTLRGNFYPIQSTARYYRWAMGVNLRGYIEKNQTDELAHFAWWFEKWKTEYPQEYDSYTDRVEGIAEYVGNSAVSVARYGNHTPASVFKTLLSIRRHWFEKFNIDLETESYLLGTLASIALDKKNVADWKQKVDGGLSPLEVLAQASLPPVPAKIDGALLAQFEQEAQKEMQTIDRDGNVQKTLDVLEKRQGTFLVLNRENWKQGAFRMSGDYRIASPLQKSTYIGLYILASPTTLVSEEDPEQKLEIRAASSSHLESAVSPCAAGEEKNPVFILPLNDYLLKNSDLTINNSEIRANIRVKTVKKNGQKWLCAI